jgi:uncharacterized membrane protein YkvI
MVKLSHLKLSFIIIGSVIGAGFITGRELIRFFGSANFIPAVYVACILLFFFSYLLMDIGRHYGTLKEANNKIFKNYSKYVAGITYFCLLIITSGMLAGIDTLLSSTFGTPSYLPIFSLPCLIFANIISSKGLDGIAKISIVLVPLMIVFILYFLLGRKNFSYAFDEEYCAFNSLIMAVLYSSMNMFLAAPILIETGNKYKYGLKKGAAIASVSIFFCIILILSAICYEGSNAIITEMPMLYITGYTGILAKIFTVMVLFAMFTSLVSSYYPLYHALEKDRKKHLKRFLLSIVAFLLSRMGLSGIVQYFYPVLGTFGIIYLIICEKYMVKDKNLFPLNSKFFNNGYNKVHNSSKQT